MATSPASPPLPRRGGAGSEAQAASLRLSASGAAPPRLGFTRQGFQRVPPRLGFTRQGFQPVGFKPVAVIFVPEILEFSWELRDACMKIKTYRR